jgi:hypothetical protein
MTMRSDGDDPLRALANPNSALIPGATPQLKAALQQFIDDFSQHSRKNSELIDVLIQALKTVNQELQQQKLKTHLLEARIKQADGQIGELSRVVEALRRQGWLQ